MQFRTILLLAAAKVAYSRTLNALVYGDTTNNVTCDCADDLGTMIANTPGFDINYNIVGPDGTPFTDDLLNSADIFAYPGGPDVGRAWKGLEPHAPALRQWVADGGRFIGICLGAYLASSGTDFAPGDGLGLLPDNDSSGEETSQDGAQVTDPDTNTVVDIDWTWGSGSHAGQTVSNRTLFFQDGIVIYLSNPDSVKILGRYSSNGDVAVTVSPYGKGWVGVSGVHVEANKSWYQDANFTNPQGIDPDYGYDLVATVLNGVEGLQSTRPAC